MSNTSTPPQRHFRDSWESLILMIALIVLGRIYLIEPFKIPSGSMEPTLFGHEDFGDRILTNKLAFMSGAEALLAAGAFLILILQGLAWAVDFDAQKMERSRLGFYLTAFLVALRVVKSFRFDWYSPLFDYAGLGLGALLVALTLFWYVRNGREIFAHRRALIWTVGSLTVILGGMGAAWAGNSVATSPHRLDVSIFEYNSGWASSAEKLQDINYIKRLWGLPGEKLKVAGGDVFKYDPASGKYRIIRKWEEQDMALQDSLWYPVSKAFEARFTDPELSDAKEEKIVKEQLRDLHFPWTGAENVSGVALEAKALTFDGTQPLELEYKFPVSSVYLKQGKWPFEHQGCPESNLPAVESGGFKWRNPNTKPDDIEAYVSNTWQGVQCPQCRRVYFPLLAPHEQNADGTMLIPKEAGLTRFYYGGENLVGDLKIELKLTLETAGAVHLEAGNTLHLAEWNIPGSPTAGDVVNNQKGGEIHVVQKNVPTLSAGEHTLILAYVDGTVIATLDGTEVERRPIDVEPIPLVKYRAAKTVAKVSLKGCKGKITALNLYRDLFYTVEPPGGMSPREPGLRYRDPADGNLVLNVPDNEFLMMGDNSPSSSDSRVWGCVPRERLMGRAWLIAWPFSRSRLIR